MPRDLEGWVNAVARNVALNHAKREGLRRQKPLPASADPPFRTTSVGGSAMALRATEAHGVVSEKLWGSVCEAITKRCQRLASYLDRQQIESDSILAIFEWGRKYPHRLAKAGNSPHRLADRIVRRIAVRETSKLKARIVEFTDQELEPARVWPDSKISCTEEHMVVIQAAIEELPILARETVHQYLQGSALTQIARHHGVSRQAARRSLQSAVKHIASELKAAGLI